MGLFLILGGALSVGGPDDENLVQIVGLPFKIAKRPDAPSRQPGQVLLSPGADGAAAGARVRTPGRGAWRPPGWCCNNPSLQCRRINHRNHVLQRSVRGVPFKSDVIRLKSTIFVPRSASLCSPGLARTFTTPSAHNCCSHNKRASN